VRYILLLTVLLASNAFAAPDFDETMAEANQGAAYAQFNLGVMYDFGMGVPENDAEAVKWYRKAADQGDAEGQYNLGVMYDFGMGVPENDAEAVKWYRKSADQGNAKAQSNLGVMYAKGEGVPENNIRAYVWWSMAKTQDDADAAGNIDILKPQMTKQQIAQAQALAAKCYESDYKDCD
jgi:TPR repeat protein